MSHGPKDSAEPNLIPLLDLVLQLVMFFMICANFVMEQVNETIKLPEAIAARPLSARDDRIIFLNLNNKGVVLLSAADALGSERALTNEKEVERYMKQRFKEDERRTGKDKGKSSLIILRADRETQFKDVHGVMMACRRAGYDRIQLRAMVTNG